MARHFEKGIQQARAVVAETGRTQMRTEPRTRDEIVSFIAGFGLSTAAQRRIVDEWEADSRRSREAGWESHADSVWYDG